MQSALTVRDLLLRGEPLDPSEVLAGGRALGNAVTWVVSLRPYPPAFPRVRGGELALVAAEHLSRLDPPVSLEEVIRYLAQRGASGVAVRGEVSEGAVAAAEEAGMPLLSLLTEMPLQDIEQAVMRECALHQARREVLPQDNTSWADRLLAGSVASLQELQSLARKGGHSLAGRYTVAYLLPHNPGAEGAQAIMGALEEDLAKEGKPGTPAPIATPYDKGIAALLPHRLDPRCLFGPARGQAACGIGTEKPVLEAAASLGEAELAARASLLLHSGAPTHYSELGADRLLLILHRDHPSELRAYVEETLGPLLRHDARSAAPLLPTVEAFIRHGGRLRETAEEVYIHRNTLAYRLERAGEILGADLKDANVRLAVDLALRALPLGVT